MDNTTHQVRLIQWSQIIEECSHRPEGMTAKQWLKDNGISEKAYYYWQRRVRKEILNQNIPRVPSVPDRNEISFTEITDMYSSKKAKDFQSDTLQDRFNADAIIKCGDSVIALSNSISDAMLSKILEVAVHAR